MEVLVCYGGGDDDDMNESLTSTWRRTTCAEVVARARGAGRPPGGLPPLPRRQRVWTRTACAVDVLIQYDDEPKVTPEVLLKHCRGRQATHSSGDAASEAMDDDLSLEATLRELSCRSCAR